MANLSHALLQGGGSMKQGGNRWQISLGFTKTEGKGGWLCGRAAVEAGACPWPCGITTAWEQWRQKPLQKGAVTAH